ncbi:TetR/AcrR family transcriptional regulator [Azoarcus sp. L1K30]|uniref:TetR/AcrR family transcriptional regulator n=1 Tax=Azoarcus sp. L1K30 TaxID=2820277 RepID=UPI0024AF619B|nr:TetR/AcrR family transcriptional regulator [Azoarcus sp. L1K30]
MNAEATGMRRRRKEARPQELTAAALSLFVEKGFAATRLDEIAARAGVSKGTLYLYFDSKEALFKAVIAEGVIPAIEAGEAMLAESADDPVSLLRSFLQSWWTMIGNTELGGIPKLMMSEAGNFPDTARYYDEAVIQRGLALLRKVVQRGIDGGIFRPVDPALIGTLLVAPLVHLATWNHSFASCCNHGIDAQAYVDAHIDLALNGLAVRTTEYGTRS